jgi:hypothetical protein
MLTCLEYTERAKELHMMLIESMISIGRFHNISLHS